MPSGRLPTLAPRASSFFFIEQIERRAWHCAAVRPLEAKREAAPQHVLLLGAGRVVESVAQHEAVELRLRQLERAALLNRVLRGDDEERCGQRVRLVADGDLALLHRLEQCALHLGRGAVDLVGEQQVGEDRAKMRAKLVVALVEHLRAEDVRRQQVDGELYAAEVQVDRV